MRTAVIERPYFVRLSRGHIDVFGEHVPDRWAVVRASSGRIVRLCPTEAEACENAAERNASRLLGER